jgi:hypothetical protein
MKRLELLIYIVEYEFIRVRNREVEPKIDSYNMTILIIYNTAWSEFLKVTISIFSLNYYHNYFFKYKSHWTVKKFDHVFKLGGFTYHFNFLRIYF